MKKYILSFILLLSIFTLASCGKVTTEFDSTTTNGGNNNQTTTEGGGNQTTTGSSNELTKQEWVAFFDSLDDYEVSYTNISSLSSKGNTLGSTETGTIYFDGDKICKVLNKASYIKSNKEIYLSYVGQEKVDQDYANYDRAYESHTEEDGVYTWYTSKPKTEENYFELCEDRFYIFEYMDKDDTIYKTKDIYDDQVFLLEGFKNSYDNARFAIDHYEFDGPGLGGVEENLSEAEVEFTYVNVIQLYFENKKLTKVVYDTHIESEIENTYMGLTQEFEITYKNEEVVLPEYTPCEHEETSIDFDDDYHYDVCYFCQSYLTKEEHTYDKVLGKCTVCDHVSTSRETLEIDCEHMVISYGKNDVNNVLTYLYVGDKEGYSSERVVSGNVETYTCPECGFKVVETRHSDENYFTEYVCSRSTYYVVEFYKNDTKVNDDLTIVSYTDFEHEVELVDTEIRNNKVYGLFECEVCHKQATEVLNFIDKVNFEYDLYSCSVKDFGYAYFNNIELPHAYNNGYCVSCGLKEPAEIATIETGEMREVTLEELAQLLPEDIDYTSFDHYTFDYVKGYLNNNKYILDDDYYSERKEHAYFKSLGSWVTFDIGQEDDLLFDIYTIFDSIDCFSSSSIVKYYVNDEYFKIVIFEDYGTYTASETDYFYKNGLCFYWCADVIEGDRIHMEESFFNYELLNLPFVDFCKKIGLHNDENFTSYVKVTKPGKEISIVDFTKIVEAIETPDEAYKTYLDQYYSSKYFKKYNVLDIENPNEYYNGTYTFNSETGYYEKEGLTHEEDNILSYLPSEFSLSTKFYEFDDNTYAYCETRYVIGYNLNGDLVIYVGVKYCEFDSYGFILRYAEEYSHCDGRIQVEERTFNYYN